MTILAQARDNGSSLKIVGGDYHVTQTKEDIIVSLRYMDRLLGLDTSALKNYGVDVKECQTFCSQGIGGCIKKCEAAEDDCKFCGSC